MCHISTGLLSVIKASPPVNTNKGGKADANEKKNTGIIGKSP